MQTISLINFTCADWNIMAIILIRWLFIEADVREEVNFHISDKLHRGELIRDWVFHGNVHHHSRILALDNIYGCYGGVYHKLLQTCPPVNKFQCLLLLKNLILKILYLWYVIINIRSIYIQIVGYFNFKPIYQNRSAMRRTDDWGIIMLAHNFY